VNTVSNEVVRHSLAFLSVQRWLVGDVPLNVNFLVKVNHPLARGRMPAMEINNDIPRTSYLHRNDYNAV